MGRKAQVRISQCMIVKNEERNIERALSWGKAMMWEQIVVDTGSSDRTVELAEGLGARVFHFPWVNDFSAAKNHAIEQARGEWIAFLDADEYMEPEDAKKMEAVLCQLSGDSFDGVSTGWQQLDDEGEIFSSGTQVRFFRNLPDIRYRRRIHEQLESLAGRELRIGDVSAEMSIFHTGYQKIEKGGKNKSERNRVLILEELKDHPESYEMMGYMGDECLGADDPEGARKWYLKAVEHMPSQLKSYDQRSAVTFTRLLGLLTEGEGGSWEEAEPVYQKAVALLAEEADFDYVAGRFLASRGEVERAAWHLETAIQKINAYGCYNKALLLGAGLFEAYELLVNCCYELRDYERCMNYGVAYLKYNKYGMGVLSRLLRVLLSDGEKGEADSQAVLDFFAKLYDFGDRKDRLFFIKTAQHSGCGGFARHGAGRILTLEEREALGFSAGEEEA